MILENELRILFNEVERHAMPLVNNDSGARLSKEESRVLALQAIHRLNQKIGFLVRTNSKEAGEMRLLQTFVNNLTLGIKNDNTQMVQSALGSVRNIILTIEKSENPP
ncbi:MAG TPA: hypothetical protein VJN71_09045 [Nitrososphaerales archaeon]|nr:hypothetical protein [Nitrososphaerales archaeon]